MYYTTSGAYRKSKMLIDYATIALTAVIMILFILILFLRSNSGILFPIVFLAGALINGLSGIKAFMNKKFYDGKDGSGISAGNPDQEIYESVEKKPVVLLECLSNLMANECFEKGGTPDAVFSDCMQLYSQCRHLVIVTNEIFSDGCLYENTTTDYIARQGRLNTQPAQEADYVAEVV